MGKEAVKFVNRLDDIAASGHIPKVVFVCWAEFKGSSKEPASESKATEPVLRFLKGFSLKKPDFNRFEGEGWGWGYLGLHL